MPLKATPQHMELVKRFHDNHPEAYTAEHMAFLKGLNIAEAAKDKIIELGAPEIAHNSGEIKRISSLPEAQHVAEIVKLHEASQRDNHENSETDRLLSERAKRPQDESRKTVAGNSRMRR
jgi:hypothetical protein